MPSYVCAQAESEKGKDKVTKDAASTEEGVDPMMGRLNILTDETEVVKVSNDEDKAVATLVKWSLACKVLSPCGDSCADSDRRNATSLGQPERPEDQAGS